MRKPAMAIKRPHASKNENNYGAVPPWLTVMYNTMFFDTCMVHPNTKKNERDRFCLDCRSSFCSHCLQAHSSHKHVKIRRYVYSDVINRQDLCKLFDCSGIQTYHTNRTKVLFLKQRNDHHHKNHGINSKDSNCVVCHKNLPDKSRYCSIACKVIAIFGDRRQREKMSEKCNEVILSGIKEEEEEEYIRVIPSQNKKPNLKQSRKGFPLRAPML